MGERNVAASLPDGVATETQGQGARSACFLCGSPPAEGLWENAEDETTGQTVGDRLFTKRRRATLQHGQIHVTGSAATLVVDRGHGVRPRGCDDRI